MTRNPCKHWVVGAIATSETACPFCEIERLKAEIKQDTDYHTDVFARFTKQIERQSAALREALLALEYHTAQTRPIHSTNESIQHIKESL